MSIAIVIGPTPPGTGEIAAARSRAKLKSTSPTILRPAGSVSGLPHCDKIGHDIENDGNCRRTIHAEHNAITQALNYGAPLEGATIYCEIEPCSSCAGMIASLGIKKIISKNSKK